MDKYTAIYVDSWMSGSHRQSITKYARLTVRPDETLKEALEASDLLNCVVFIFEGHPKLEGENNV